MSSAHPPSDPEPGTGPYADSSGPREVIAGRYRLLQKLGEGGFGIVYLAEQREPVQRQVALKIIKPGMDSAQVIARFEQERQALALMDHPHIAKVLDGGTTEAGRPFFVMELVKGVPITKFCDEQKLTPRQRLELFIPVCQAIQHAHQKGIIHRDIKPSNVLVMLQDGKPIPKVIDFGVAKALHQRLTDHTMFTEIGAVVGTPEYMSPEQAGVNQLDIDTRSDIYALGVLLYELLTGVTPLDRKRLREAARDEVLRLIREVDPPRPSTRITTVDGLPAIAAHRQIDPKKLGPFLRGDLDWIVMKALEKDRNRRYETANGFAMDIGRYLADEPVLAGPPSARYRLRKFLKRNKGSVVAAALVLLALVVGIVGTTVGLVRAARAEQRANAERDRAEANFRQARQAVDDYFTQVSEDTLLKSPLPGLQPLRKKLLETALKYYQAFAEKHGSDPALRAELAAAYYRVGDITDEIGAKADALKAFRQARDLYAELAEAGPASAAIRHELARSNGRLADLVGETGQPAEAVECYQKALDLWAALDREGGDSRRWRSELARTYRRLAKRRQLMGQQPEALAAYKRAITMGEELRSRWPDDPRLQADLAESYNQVANYYQFAGHLALALQAAREAVTIGEKLAAAHPHDHELQANLARSSFELALVQRIAGPPRDAIAPFQKAIAIWEKLIQDSPAVNVYPFELGKCYWSLGNLQCDLDMLSEALKSGEQGRDLLTRLTRANPGHQLAWQHLANSYLVIGKVQAKRNRAKEALEAFKQGIDILTKVADAEPMMNYYNLACIWSLSSAVVGQGKAKLTAEEQANQKQYADQAMKALGQAVAAGFRSLEDITTDPDLKALHPRPDFEKLVKELQSKAAVGAGKEKKEK